MKIKSCWKTIFGNPTLNQQASFANYLALAPILALAYGTILVVISN